MSDNSDNNSDSESCERRKCRRGGDSPPRKHRRGRRGSKGCKGKVGPEGERGFRGPTGEKGDTGAAGDVGKKGRRGEEGPCGPSGATGEVGETGRRGSVGHTGVVGSEGPQGATGLNGANGPQGPTGLKGATGATGAKGQNGGNVSGAYFCDVGGQELETTEEGNFRGSIVFDTTVENLENSGVTPLSPVLNAPVESFACVEGTYLVDFKFTSGSQNTVSVCLADYTTEVPFYTTGAKNVVAGYIVSGSCVIRLDRPTLIVLHVEGSSGSTSNEVGNPDSSVLINDASCSFIRIR